MTYKEKLMQEHPEEVDKRYLGGCYGCPRDYGYEAKTPQYLCGLTDIYYGERCTKCWNRKIEERLVEHEICR